MNPTPSPGRVTLAYGQVLLAGALWATSGPLSIALFRMGVPATSVALLRPAVGVCFLGLFLAYLRARRPVEPVEVSGPRRGGRALAGMLLLGGVIVGIFQLSYQMSTDAVGVPATVALLYLAPALVIAASVKVFGERLTLAKGTLALASIAGVWMTVFGTRGVDVDLTLRGILWGCVCGGGYAAYTLFGKWYGREHGPLLPLFWSTLGGTILLGAVWWAREVPVVLPPTILAWVVLGALGLFTMAVAALLLFDALRILDAGRASIGTTIEPFVATLLAWSFLGQTLTPLGQIGLVVLVVGVAGAYGMRISDAPAPPGPGTEPGRPLLR
ncbi:MAG: DMT family transporter [Gemmatimonadota bacterium]